jgi:hypothetical protein
MSVDQEHYQWYKKSEDDLLVARHVLTICIQESVCHGNPVSIWYYHFRRPDVGCDRKGRENI